MKAIRDKLKKIVELYEPRPQDEKDFVAKHKVQAYDYQGRDSISKDSPYDLMLKNLESVKKPGDPGKDDHGHDAPGESEAAYHIPESREAKIAKLSEMMGNEKEDKDDEDEDEDEEDEDDEDEDDEDEEDEDEIDAKASIKEASKQPVGVEVHYSHPSKKPFKVTHFSVGDAERARKEYEKMGYKAHKKKIVMGEAMTSDEERMQMQRVARKAEVVQRPLKKEIVRRGDDEAARAENRAIQAQYLNKVIQNP